MLCARGSRTTAARGRCARATLPQRPVRWCVRPAQQMEAAHRSATAAHRVRRRHRRPRIGLPLGAAGRCRIRKTADASLPVSPVARADAPVHKDRRRDLRPLRRQNETCRPGPRRRKHRPILAPLGPSHRRATAGTSSRAALLAEHRPSPPPRGAVRRVGGLRDRQNLIAPRNNPPAAGKAPVCPPTRKWSRSPPVRLMHRPSRRPSLHRSQASLRP
jgi:hypothetical protein